MLGSKPSGAAICKNRVYSGGRNIGLCRKRRGQGHLDAAGATGGSLVAFAGGRPTEAAAKGLFIKLALDGVDGASLVEAEYFVVEVKAVGNGSESFGELVGSLKIDLKVAVEVLVTVGALQAASAAALGYGAGVSSGVVVSEDLGLVVGHAEADGEVALVIGGREVIRVGRLAEEGCGGSSGAAVWAADGSDGWGRGGGEIDKGGELGLGSGVAVVGRETEAVEQTGEIGKVLLEGDLEAVDVVTQNPKTNPL